MAFTEHETISNALKIEKYYNKVKEKHPDFKVIRGNEIYLVRDGLDASNYERGIDRYYHFILLAKDAIGHEQIRELSTRAWMRSYSSYGMVRVPTYYNDLIEIIQANPGHVIGSTACLGSFSASKIVQWAQEGYNKEFLNKIKNWLLLVQGIFGKDNFYLEMQPSKNKDQILVNTTYLTLSEELNIPYIITTDSHYLSAEERPIHTAFLKSQDGERETDEFYATTYMMATEELESFFDYLSKEQLQIAYDNILNIKNQCEDYSLLKSLKIPSMEWKTPKGIKIDWQKWYKRVPQLQKFNESSFDGDNLMARLVVEKMEGDPRLQTQEAYDALNDNLDATWISSEVNKTHWSAYFLNLQKIIDICWEAGSLVGPLRGSAGGFFLLYLLDLIQVNPLWENTKLFPWRFLNPYRASVLDIDTDIEGGRRAVVLDALRKHYGQDRVANVVTFSTEKAKSAIQTAARGLGVEVEEALYIASLIPADRGIQRTLKQCYYGDVENGFRAIPEFIREMDNNPELWKVSQRIEGLINRIGEHAGGVVFVDEPFTKSTALMKVPNGDVVTQFDLHDDEDVSLIKIDLLSVEYLDKIHVCLDLLMDDGYIVPEATLRETYEKTIGIYNLDRTSPEMWKMVNNHKIHSLFQWEQQSGIQGINLAHPQTIDELAVLNSIIRLMKQDGEVLSPLEKYANFKADISQWYNEMKIYGLSAEDVKVLEPIIKSSYGLADSQEKDMLLVQIPECGGFDLSWADKLRKSIAKKNPAQYEEMEKEYFKTIKEKNLSEPLCNYVWKVLISMSRGYAFNSSHTLGYSLAALQEMNLAYKYPIIYWNTACLITDTGGVEEIEGGKSADYNKLARGLSKIINEKIKISLPDINKSSYTFKPDEENNQILFGLRGMLNVGDNLINDIIKNRPYSSPKDFLNKIKPNRQAMVSLIKAGVFDNMMDRKICMGWYLWETCDKKKRITLQNVPGLIKNNLLPEHTKEQQTARRIYEFNRYLKSVCKSNENYILDDRAINFITEMNYDNLFQYKDNHVFINQKSWDKIYQTWMNIFRKWISENHDEILSNLNKSIFKADWEKYALGNLSSWEMEALSFYYHDHELAHINNDRYGFANFEDLPEEPIIDRTFKRGDKTINLFKLFRICGTCIAKNKTRHIVTLLTTSGVVDVKLNKDHFAYFDKRISMRGDDGVKHTVESSWFNRGNMLVVQGIRSGDMFMAKRYASSSFHQLYHIDKIDKDGTIELRSERAQGDAEEDE